MHRFEHMMLCEVRTIWEGSRTPLLCVTQAPDLENASKRYLCSGRCAAEAHYAHSSLKESNLVWPVVRVGLMELVANQSRMGATSLVAPHHVDVCYNAAGWQTSVLP